jgi:hypothetical protein
MPISPDPMQYGNTSFVRTIYIDLIEYIFLALVPGNISAYIGNRALNLCVHIEYQFFIWGAGYSQKHFFKYGLNNRGFFLCNNSNKQICMLNINLLHKHFCGRKSYCKRKHSDIQQSI